jgi:cytidylate kinase
MLLTQMMQFPPVITIDGPAGAGKSTLGELLARRLGYLYFDTGIMYRALTLAAIEQRIDPRDEQHLAALAERLTISVEAPQTADGRQYTVRIDGRDVTWDLRGADVERNVSLVAAHPAVRAVMRAQQRAIGVRGRIVMVGRDIGTVVMPDAQLKIYLQTSLHERARRRAHQLRERGTATHVQDIRSDVARRDALDQHVMEPAPDAIVLDCDGLSPEDEVEVILTHLRARASLET